MCTRYKWFLVHSRLSRYLVFPRLSGVGLLPAELRLEKGWEDYNAHGQISNLRSKHCASPFVYLSLCLSLWLISVSWRSIVIPGLLVPPGDCQFYIFSHSIFNEFKMTYIELAFYKAFYKAFISLVRYGWERLTGPWLPCELYCLVGILTKIYQVLVHCFHAFLKVPSLASFPHCGWKEIDIEWKSV